MERRGIFGILSILVFSATISTVYYFVYQSSGTQHKVMHAVFGESVNGLENGSYVLYLGVRVGKVTSVKLKNDHVYVDFIIDTEFTINESSYVILEGDGIAARRLLNIYTPNLDEPPLESNKIKVKKAMSWNNMNHEILRLIREARQVLARVDKTLVNSDLPGTSRATNRLLVDLSVLVNILNARFKKRPGMLWWFV